MNLLECDQIGIISNIPHKQLIVKFVFTQFLHKYILVRYCQLVTVKMTVYIDPVQHNLAVVALIFSMLTHAEVSGSTLA